MLVTGGNQTQATSVHKFLVNKDLVNPGTPENN